MWNEKILVVPVYRNEERTSALRAKRVTCVQGAQCGLGFMRSSGCVSLGIAMITVSIQDLSLWTLGLKRMYPSIIGFFFGQCLRGARRKTESPNIRVGAS